MFKQIKYILFTFIVISSVLLTACGTNGSQDAVIQTAVAQTVIAQNAQQITNTETPSAPVTDFTQTPVQFSPTLTPPVLPTQPLNPSKLECAKASLESETIVDGTIFKPGEAFTKTWEITNTSTCVWDTNYKIVFLSGDLLGGGYVYNLPQITPPGKTVPISLVLIAPATDGEYTSEWMLQTPDNIIFGVGMYSKSIFTKIVVSSAEKPAYTVTSVDYVIVRTPDVGCTTNVTYTVYATFTTNGPFEFKYIWIQQDGNSSGSSYGPGKGTIKMTAAGKTTVSRQWKLHLGATPGSQRWFSINITSPFFKEYPPVYFTYDCK
jgi:hypothetical protein